MTPGTSATLELTGLRAKAKRALDYGAVGEAQAALARAHDIEDRDASLKMLGSIAEHLGREANPLGLDRDDDRALVRHLVRQGWDTQAGSLLAPNFATGGHTKMWPVDLVFGAPSADPGVAPYQKAVRLSLRPEYSQAFRAWVAAAIRCGDGGVALASMDAGARKALSEGSDTAGGFTVPGDWNAQVQSRLAERSIFRQHADVRQTVSDVLRIPRFIAHSSQGSVYASDFVASLVGETPNQSDTAVQFGQVLISIFKPRAKTVVSNDLAADQPNLFAWLTSNGGQSLAAYEDSLFIGAGPGPLGISRDPTISTINIAGSTANSISNTSGAVGSAPKLLDLEGTLPDQYAVDARWLMQRASLRKVRQLIDGQSHFMFPAERDGAGNQTLLDYPVSVSTACEADGVAGNRPVIFGSLRQGYVVATRMLTSVRIATERYADSDQTLFVLFDRIGGCPVNPDAFRLGVV